jgi:hypothetical protein
LKEIERGLESFVLQLQLARFDVAVTPIPIDNPFVHISRLIVVKVWRVRARPNTGADGSVGKVTARSSSAAKVEGRRACLLTISSDVRDCGS